MRKSIAVLLLIIAVSVAAIAQSADAGIHVTVRNQLGELIAGAEVTLTRNGEIVIVGSTDDEGIVRFRKLAPGVYRISVTAAGFNQVTSDDLTVSSGKLEKTELTLDVMTVESNVSVGGDESVDSENFGGTRIIDEDEIKKLPDAAEDLERALRALAGETPTGENAPISVDGQVGAKLPPKEAIKQIRINQNVFSAQYEGPFGGGIEIFTSSNTKKYTGAIGFSFSDSRINAADAFIGQRLPAQFRAVSFSLAGPLGKRGNFFMFGSRGQNESSVAINARTLDSALRPVDLKEFAKTPSNDFSLYSNVSLDFGKKHKLTFNYSVNYATSQNQNVGGLSLLSRANSTRNGYHNFRLSETFLKDENSVIQSRFSASYFDTDSFGGDTSPAINVLESFFGGGSQNDRRTKTFNIDGGSDATWQHGDYVLGLGFQLRANAIGLRSTSNFGGTYTFSGRLAPVLDANGNPVLDTNGNFLMTQIDSLESYRRTLYFLNLGRSPAQVRTLGGGASQFTIAGGDPAVSVRQFDAAAYIQNSYKIDETLAVSFGLRYENQTNVDSDFNASPRIGIIWSPKADPKKNPLFAPPRISVGYGLFYRRFEVSNFLAIEQSRGTRSQYLVIDPNVLDAFPARLTVAQLQQSAVPQSRRYISDDVETPAQSLFSITASKRLPLEFSANFSMSYSRTSRLALTRNVNAPLPGTFNPQNPNGGVRPLGSIGDVYETNSQGGSETTRFSVSLNFPQKIIWGNVSYSFTKSRSDNTAGSGSPFDPYDFAREFGRDPNDGVHRLSIYFFYNKLPFGISVDGNGDLSSGKRFNIVTGRDTNGDGFYLERPAFAADPTKPGVISTPYGYLDPNPLPGDELIPRNLGRGPRTLTFDLGIGKTFKFGEDKEAKKPPKRSIYFGVRINNLFNVVNRAAPIGNMSSPNFLRTVTTAASDFIYIVNGIRGGAANRSFAFTARYSFL